MTSLSCTVPQAGPLTIKLYMLVGVGAGEGHDVNCGGTSASAFASCEVVYAFGVLWKALGRLVRSGHRSFSGLS
jgi:hypothetical protein